jgi:hypothetical protein
VAVQRLTLQRSRWAGARPYGDVGPYDQLLGTAEVALDPANPANAAIVDLDLAPREADGLVHACADVRILQPAYPARGNRRLLLDVVNRGNPVAIRNTDFGPKGVPETDGEGWLLAQGYTVVSCGWQHNVPRGTARLGLQAPAAVDPAGRPLRGQVRSILQVNEPTQTLGVADEPSGAVHVAYPVADPAATDATLAERDHPLSPRRVIPRDEWHFAQRPDGSLVPDRTHLYFPAGFQPGKVYELIYTAEGAPVTGLGFAVLRDVVSDLRFSAAPDAPGGGYLEYALAFGGSQTGRLMRHLLYLGLDVDEAGRAVFDGILTLIAGPTRTEGNWRFGQPSFIGSDSPGFGFPFTDATQTDPHSGRRDGLLARQAARDGRRPKVMHANTSAEYVNLANALIHLQADGQADAEVPDDVRIYHLTGTHHGGGSLPLDNRVFTSVASYYNNSIDYRPLVRALVQALDDWATRDVAPPPSRYPRLDDGTLVAPAVLRAAAARLPGPGLPAERLYPTERFDYGARASAGQASFPPRDDGPYPYLVPAVDADGNECSGVRHPDVQVPLATYTGWNPRDARIGGSEMNLLLNGATIPFPRTAAEAARTGDPRAPIDARYASRDAFLIAVEAAATTLAAERYLLASDVAPLVAASAQRYDEFTALESPLPQ